MGRSKGPKADPEFTSLMDRVLAIGGMIDTGWGWALVDQPQLQVAVGYASGIRQLVEQSKMPQTWVLREAIDAYEAIPAWLRRAIEAGVQLILVSEFEGPTTAMRITRSYLRVASDAAARFGRLLTLKGVNGLAIREDRPEADGVQRPVAPSGRTFSGQEKSGASQTPVAPTPASKRDGKAFTATAA